MIIHPIEEKTIKLFSGREQELQDLDYLLNALNLAVIEGPYGVGKTSLGNYYRFSKKAFITPSKEISTDPRWSTKDFLHEVLKSLLDTAGEDKELLKTHFMRSLLKRYNYLVDNKVGLEIMGNSLTYEERDSKESVQTVAGLSRDLESLAKNMKDINKEVIIQLNNLDLGSSFSEKDFLRFFSLNRNVFQIESVKWILTGSEGLSDLFLNKLIKFGSLLGEPIKLSSLSKDAMLDTIKKRGLYIFDKKTMEFLVKDNDLRVILKKLNFYKEGNKTSLFEENKFTEKEKEFIHALGDNSLTQKEISKKLKLSKAAISSRTKTLIFKRAVVQNEDGTYRNSFEVYLSFFSKK